MILRISDDGMLMTTYVGTPFNQSLVPPIPIPIPIVIAMMCPP